MDDPAQKEQNLIIMVKRLTKSSVIQSSRRIQQSQAATNSTERIREEIDKEEEPALQEVGGSFCKSLSSFKIRLEAMIGAQISNPKRWKRETGRLRMDRNGRTLSSLLRNSESTPLMLRFSTKSQREDNAVPWKLLIFDASGLTQLEFYFIFTKRKLTEGEIEKSPRKMAAGLYTVIFHYLHL